MHDPKTSGDEVQRFEQEVQQRMEGLQFHPSEAVWANVQLAMKGKKRRRVPFFWLFFLPAILLGGAAGIYFMGAHSNHALTSNADKAAVLQPGADQQAKIDQPSNQPPGDQLPIVRSSDDQPDQQPGYQQTGAAPSAENGPASVSSHNTRPGAVKPANSRFGTASSEAEETAGQELAANRDTANGTTAGRAGSQQVKATGKGFVPVPTTAGNTASLNKEAAAGDKEGVSNRVVATAEPFSAVIINKPATVHANLAGRKNIPKVEAASLSPRTKTPALSSTRLTPKRPWEAGFAGGVGISSLNQGLFKRSTIDSRNFFITSTVTGPPAAQTYISKVQPDLSFWAGIFLQKPILNDLSVSFGLNLHYYSTKVYTGDKITSNSPSNNYYFYSPSNQLLASAAAAGPIPSYPYYAAGDQQAFINRYYFLEIPGSIQWQISHNPRMPLFWEGGFSLSYLVSSNAIYYNTKAGVYYKDGEVTNRTQFNISTALMVGIPFKGLRIQVGPQLQYGFTGLLNAQTAGGQHLFYGGLKLVVFPGKSHKAGKHLFSE